MSCSNFSTTVDKLPEGQELLKSLVNVVYNRASQEGAHYCEACSGGISQLGASQDKKHGIRALAKRIEKGEHFHVDAS